MTNIMAVKGGATWERLSVAQRRVVHCLRQAGPLTREQLGQRLGLPASSISREVGPLLEEGTLASDPPGKRRRNAALSNAPSIAYAIGVEIGFEHVRAAILDFCGHPVGGIRHYRPDNKTNEAFLRCTQKVIRELSVQPEGRQALGIGIGFADRASWNPLQEFARDKHGNAAPHLAESIRTIFGLPVFTGGDAACAALGERRSGRLADVDNGLMLLYDQGIGLGIIARGNVVFGGCNDAGEIGHIPLELDGEYCHCGNVGCLETVASGWALRRKAKQIISTGGQVGFRRTISPDPRVDELCAMAKAGDPLAHNMLTKAGKSIGRALVISASLLDPEVIVLGGVLARVEDYELLISSIRDTFGALTAHRTPQPIKIETSVLGIDAAVIGAAEIVFSEMIRA